jgi:hypothetical protein
MSTPVVASLITLINEERIKRGKGPVGFLNPVLYANAGAMNDIKVGGNEGCGTSGFRSVTGWVSLISSLTSPFFKRESREYASRKRLLIHHGLLFPNFQLQPGKSILIR